MDTSPLDTEFPRRGHLESSFSQGFSASGSGEILQLGSAGSDPSTAVDRGCGSSLHHPCTTTTAVDGGYGSSLHHAYNCAMAVTRDCGRSPYKPYEFSRAVGMAYEHS